MYTKRIAIFLLIISLAFNIFLCVKYFEEKNSNNNESINMFVENKKAKAIKA